MKEVISMSSDSLAEPGPLDSRQRLEALAERLRAEGWYAQVAAADGRLGLVRVVNPAAPPLNDDIRIGVDGAGLWWFRWSFGDRIAHVDNVDIAAARIIQVLGCPCR
ncbi:hypothetical protein [Actinoallomurus rhizosphaericola]|uniref:hypothetical protein n=1 Tax=Actinoallomurus rhizosphaericola TaxID=2952536 RepID=UPI00209056CE|nr:hypothetical protein [Actinoallomurus rhizosphaericola]MCO5992819.1 hypothetical protein [Actinoallomurus rhizosphaericola]